MSDQPTPYGPPPPGQPPYGPPQGYDPGPRFEVGQAFTWAWAKFRTNIATLMLATLVILLVTGLAYAIAILTATAIVPDATFFIESDPQTGEIDGLGSYFATLGIIYLAIFVLSIPLSVVSAGFVRLGLLLAEGKEIRLSDMFRVGRAWRIMAMTVLVSLGTLVGLVLCYLPGLAFGLFAAFSLYFVLDHDQSPIGAISSSFRLVKNNFGSALVAVLLGGLVASAGMLACVVGILVSAPVAMLVHVYTYKILSGVRVAA